MSDNCVQCAVELDGAGVECENGEYLCEECYHQWSNILSENDRLKRKLAAAVARAEKAEADRDRLAAELELMKNCGNCDEHVDCGYVDVCYYGPANLVEDHWRPRKRG